MIGTKAFYIIKSAYIRGLSKRTRFNNGFAALLYHRISAKEPKNELIPSLINGSSGDFEEELKYLIKNFNVISMGEALNRLEHEGMLPENSLILTFDDGYQDNYTNAFPILKRYGIPATVFLTADSVGDNPEIIWTDRIAWAVGMASGPGITVKGLGKVRLGSGEQRKRAAIRIIEYIKIAKDMDRGGLIDSIMDGLSVREGAQNLKGLYLSASQIKEMSMSVITFGSHGCTHKILSGLTIDEISEEALKSKRKIESITGKKADCFAYPNGTKKDFNGQAAVILRENGYRAAFTTIPGVNRAGNAPDMFSLKRIPAGRSFREMRNNLFVYL